MTKPADYPDFATSATYTTTAGGDTAGESNKLAYTPTQLLDGEHTETAPDAKNFNWLMSKLGLWVRYLESQQAGVYEYTFSNSVTTAEPSAGVFKLNNADPTIATSLRISDTTANSEDLEALLSTGGRLVATIANKSLTVKHRWNVTNTISFSTSTGWVVEHMEGDGAFVNGDSYVVRLDVSPSVAGILTGLGTDDVQDDSSLAAGTATDAIEELVGLIDGLGSDDIADESSLGTGSVTEAIESLVTSLAASGSAAFEQKTVTLASNQTSWNLGLDANKRVSVVQFSTTTPGTSVDAIAKNSVSTGHILVLANTANSTVFKHNFGASGEKLTFAEATDQTAPQFAGLVLVAVAGFWRVVAKSFHGNVASGAGHNEATSADPGYAPASGADTTKWLGVKSGGGYEKRSINASNVVNDSELAPGGFINATLSALNGRSATVVFRPGGTANALKDVYTTLTAVNNRIAALAYAGFRGTVIFDGVSNGGVVTLNGILDLLSCFNVECRSVDSLVFDCTAATFAAYIHRPFSSIDLDGAEIKVTGNVTRPIYLSATVSDPYGDGPARVFIRNARYDYSVALRPLVSFHSSNDGALHRVTFENVATYDGAPGNGDGLRVIDSIPYGIQDGSAPLTVDWVGPLSGPLDPSAISDSSLGITDLIINWGSPYDPPLTQTNWNSGGTVTINDLRSRGFTASPAASPALPASSVDTSFRFGAGFGGLAVTSRPRLSGFQLTQQPAAGYAYISGSEPSSHRLHTFSGVMVHTAASLPGGTQVNVFFTGTYGITDELAALLSGKSNFKVGGKFELHCDADGTGDGIVHGTFGGVYKSGAFYIGYGSVESYIGGQWTVDTIGASGGMILSFAPIGARSNATIHVKIDGMVSFL